MSHFGIEVQDGPWLNVTTNNTCPDGVQWIKNLFGECVLDIEHYIAVIVGIISIVAWLLNGIPQMVENCKRGIPDEAVSPWLLIFWTCGDTCNLLGCILTHQLPLQMWSAAYSIVCDLILIGQFIYALVKHRREAVDDLRRAAGSLNVEADSIEASTGSVHSQRALACVLTMWSLVFLLPSGQRFSSLSDYSGYNSGRRLLYYHPVFYNTTDILGYLLGVISGLFYFSARIPQLLKNFMRKTTDGLSIGLFIFAVIGNTTYGLQIFLTSVDSTFLIRHTPWLVGSVGVLALDFVMLFQFFLYRGNKPQNEEDFVPLVIDEEPLV